LSCESNSFEKKLKNTLKRQEQATWSKCLDALADIGYILAGTIINHGMQHIYDDAFNEVHRSNMAKLVDGKAIRREDGKVLKPEGWQPPQLAQFLEE
jgi:predicted HAD superfamily Cof-like phosphohydrolase